MANKNQIETLINQNLADFSDIVPSEHREVEHALLGDLYNTNIRETNASLTLCNPIADLEIDLYFSKVGGFVTIQGTFINQSANVMSGVVLNITNPDYYPVQLPVDSVAIATVRGVNNVNISTYNDGITRGLSCSGLTNNGGRTNFTITYPVKQI